MRSFPPKCSIEGSRSIEASRPKAMPGGVDGAPICVTAHPASTTGPFPKGGCRPRCAPVWATSSPGPDAIADGSPSAASRSSKSASTPNCLPTRRSRASSTSKGSLPDGRCGPTCCSSTSIGVRTAARRMFLSRSITSDLALGGVPIASATWLWLATSAIPPKGPRRLTNSAIPRLRESPGDRCGMQPLSMRHALRWLRRYAALACPSAPGREDEPAGIGRAWASRKRMPTTRCAWERSQASSWGGSRRSGSRQQAEGSIVAPTGQKKASREATRCVRSRYEALRPETWCERRCQGRSRQQVSTWDGWQCGLLAHSAWAKLTVSTRAIVSWCRERMGMSTNGPSRRAGGFTPPLHHRKERLLPPHL